MKGIDNILSWLWRVTNPSLIWLPFALPFLLGGSGVFCGSLLMVVLAMVGQRGRRFSWRLTLFVPLLLLLLSQSAFVVYYPPRIMEWRLVTIALGAGWLWWVTHLLRRENPLGVEEWLFSVRLFGFGSIVYLLTYELLHRQPYWLPAPLLVLGVGLHYWRLWIGVKVEREFCCPINSPLVRMAIVRGEEVWLTDTPYTGCYVDGECNICHTPEYRDHPLTSCINEGESAEEALTRAFSATGLHPSSTPHFLLKYQHQFCGGSRVIYLFVLNLRGDECADVLSLRGRFYSSSEVAERIERGLFTPLFVEEYTCLQRTLLRANSFAKP